MSPRYCANTCPSTTVRGLLEAAETHTMFDYYSDRWRRDSSNGNSVEWVGTMLGRIADRGLVIWPASGMSDVTITEYGARYLAWLRGGRRGKKPAKPQPQLELDPKERG